MKAENALILRFVQLIVLYYRHIFFLFAILLG